MNSLVIEKKAVKQNIAAIKAAAGSAPVCAMLGGDGYGAGIAPMADILRDEGIGRFAVTDSAEAETLRKAGFVDEEILMLRSVTEQTELERLIDLGVICSVGAHDTGVALNALAEGRATVAEAWLQVDAGRGPGGFLLSEPDQALNMYRYLPSVAFSGVYARLGGSGKAARAALEGVQALIKQVHEAGFETGPCYLAASLPLLCRGLGETEGYLSDAALLGRGRRRRDDGLFRVGYGEAPVSQVRWLPKGHAAGAEGSALLRRPARVAVLPVGYQNGLGVMPQYGESLPDALRRWWAGRRLTVRIGGQPVKILGKIGAAETLLDVTNLKCAAGDLAVFDLDPLYAKGLKREYR